MSPLHSYYTISHYDILSAPKDNTPQYSLFMRQSLFVGVRKHACYTRDNNHLPLDQWQHYDIDITRCYYFCDSLYNDERKELRYVMIF